MTSAGLTMQIASTPIAFFALVQAVTYLMAPTASLVSITEDDHDVHLYLAYATADNFMGRSVYRNAYCYLHPDAEKALSRASLSARQAGVRLLVFDAYRPAQAQQILFDYAQDPTFVADPKRGSHHTRGCAVDVSLRRNSVSFQGQNTAILCAVQPQVPGEPAGVDIGNGNGARASQIILQALLAAEIGR